VRRRARRHSSLAVARSGTPTLESGLGGVWAEWDVGHAPLLVEQESRRQHAEFVGPGHGALQASEARPEADVEGSGRVSEPANSADATVEEEDKSQTQTLSDMGHGARAGQLYGTLNRGQLYGEEIRPALPIQTSDPVVWPWQLPDVAGNEVIEITIDERGDITAKKVLQSLGPDIDTKCLAALENWRFHPATRNGSPIPSKQDAIFPFRARG